MDQRVQIVITLMEKRLHRDLSLEEMAQSVDLSASRLRHLFKAEVGASPVHYLRLLRMQRAREMVETTFLSMKEIMSNAGEAGPVSDADIALLNNWLAGQDGHLVEDTGIALAQQGSQQMGKDAWLNYCLSRCWLILSRPRRLRRGSWRRGESVSRRSRFLYADGGSAAGQRVDEYLPPGV